MKNLLENRVFSFVVVFLVYAIAIVEGVFLYQRLQMPFWLALLVCDVVCTVVVFIFSLAFENASVYDPYWSVQPIVIVLLFLFIREVDIFGIILISAICFWGIRLTSNWAYTFKNLTHQDWRYTMLKEKTGPFYFFVNFFGIHLVPTLIVYGCTLPAVYVIYNYIRIKPISIVFIGLSFLAVILQGIADIQMHKFRKNQNSVTEGSEEKKSPFIRNGLWKYSRHPNYLGEILMWWGIGLSVFFADFNLWYLLAGAFLNTLLFLFISIPMADKHQKQRKPGFDEYKSQTRMLLPIKK